MSAQILKKPALHKKHGYKFVLASEALAIAEGGFLLPFSSYEFALGGKVWLELYQSKKGLEIRVSAQYASDGCSLWRNGKRTHACVFHDALRQALNKDCSFPLTRAQVDKIFLELLEASKICKEEASLMHWAVSGWLGRLFSFIKNQRRPRCPNDCKRCALHD